VPYISYQKTVSGYSMKSLLLIIISDFMIGCNPYEFNLKEVSEIEFNSKEFFSKETDTLWRSENENLLYLKKHSRENRTHFLVLDDTYLKIDWNNCFWVIENDSFIVYKKGQHYDKWEMIEGDYNGFWSEIDPTWTRTTYPIEQPDSIKKLPKKLGIYKVEQKDKFIKVLNTHDEGLYYNTKCPYGILEKIKIIDLIERKTTANKGYTT
jgi:hypothetical protein